MAMSKTKKDNNSTDMKQLKIDVLATIEDIKSKLHKKGIQVNGYKAIFNGEICRITIKTPKGKRYGRFGIETFKDNEMAVMVKNFAAKKLIEKLANL